MGSMSLNRKWVELAIRQLEFNGPHFADPWDKPERGSLCVSDQIFERRFCRTSGGYHHSHFIELVSRYANTLVSGGSIKGHIASIKLLVSTF
jgi:hypothetical protein